MSEMQRYEKLSVLMPVYDEARTLRRIVSGQNEISADTNRRWLFIGSAILPLALSVINVRGTSLVSFVFAAIVIAIVKYRKEGL